MEVELDSDDWNGIWEPIPRPAKQKMIGVKWIFKTKYLGDGSLEKHTPRLLVKNYAQRPSTNYDNTFAPTTRMAPIKPSLGLAHNKQWSLFQMDATSAFLNGKLKEEVYVGQPLDF